MGDGHRLLPHGPHLQHAAFVVASAFFGVLVTEVDFDPGELVGKARQAFPNVGLDLRGQLVAAYDVVVRVYLNVHEFISLRVVRVPGVHIETFPPTGPGPSLLRIKINANVRRRFPPHGANREDTVRAPCFWSSVTGLQ